MTELPDGWTLESLSDVASWGSGGTPQAGHAAFYGGGIPWAVIGDLNEATVVETRASITDAGLAASSAKLVPAGAVLLAMYGSIGKLGIAGRPMATNQAIAFALPNERVLRKYLFYYLMSQRHQLDAAGKGATQRNISQTVLRPWPILLPETLDEQQRIVNILEDHLSRLDATDVSFVAVLAKMNALRDAIIHSALFADQAGEAEQRSQVTVGAVADVDSGPAFKSSLFGGPGEGTRLLRGDNIEPGSLRWGRTKSWPDSQLVGFEHLLVADGDIILAMDRPVVTAGLKLARVTGADMPALLVQRVARIRPRNTVVDDFLYQILSSRQFVHELLGNQVGTQIPHITLEAIRKFPFLLPKPAVQIAIANQVRAHIDSTERVEHDVTLASTRSLSLRRSLLAAAFSGRLTGRSSDMEMVEEMAGV